MLSVTIRHHFEFGPGRALVGDVLNDTMSWDALRLEGDQGFRIAANRAELEQLAAGRADICGRMARLANWLVRNDVRSVASYGVGTALAEYWLCRLLPGLSLALTETGPRTCARLKLLFPDASVLLHDLRMDAPLSGDLHLFHRIDTEFSNREWRTLLSRFASQRIIVVATETLTWRRAIVEMGRALQPGTTRAGWLRNRAGFESFLGTVHDFVPLRLGDLPAWSLTPRHPV